MDIRNMDPYRLMDAYEYEEDYYRKGNMRCEIIRRMRQLVVLEKAIRELREDSACVVDKASTALAEADRIRVT